MNWQYIGRGVLVSGVQRQARENGVRPWMIPTAANHLSNGRSMSVCTEVTDPNGKTVERPVFGAEEGCRDCH